MTFEEARKQFNLILDDLKVERGETVHLSTDFSCIPLPKIDVPLTREGMRSRERDWNNFVLDAMLDRLGPSGTLILATASYDYARYGKPYIHEESPAEVSAFCEFFRTQPGTIRSLHPIFSLGGQGKNAAAILEDVGKAAFGVSSPYGRFGKFDTKFVFFGNGLRGLTHGYHLQQMYGVNHMYNKLYNGPVYRGGQLVDGPWLACVRYLGVGVERDFYPLELAVRADGTLNESARMGAKTILSVSVADVERVGYRMLEQDPWAMISNLAEIHVAAPGSAPPVTKQRSAFLEWAEQPA